MKIGIIGPTENEIIPFIESMEIREKSSYAKLTFYAGIYDQIEVVALFCGVCKVNAAIAAQLLIDHFNVTHMIVVGVAGAIDNSLKIRDTVISTKLTYHDVDAGILTEYHPYMPSIYFDADHHLLKHCQNLIQKYDFVQKIVFGKMVTGEAFISDEGRSEIKARYSPLCVDMESASIAHVAYANNIPFLAIRTISDTEDESGLEVFEDNSKSTSLNSIDFLKKLLKEFSNV
jgi:adenosylhomocysteine nucleosidase